MRLHPSIAPAAVLLLAACGPGAPDSAAERVAREMQSDVGRVSGPVRVESIEAEGDLVIITLDGEENWRRGYPSFMVTAAVLRGLCEKHRGSFLGGSVAIRVDSLEAGRNRVNGEPVRRCPD